MLDDGAKVVAPASCGIRGMREAKVPLFDLKGATSGIIEVWWWRCSSHAKDRNAEDVLAQDGRDRNWVCWSWGPDRWAASRGGLQ